MGVEGTGCGRKQDELEKSIKQTVCTKGNDKYNARDVIEIMRSFNGLIAERESKFG